MYKHLKPIFYKAVLLSMVLSLLAFTIALAASGDLDTSFSGDGRVTTNFGLAPGRADYLSGIAIQSNGKIVAVGSSSGDFAVTRYNVNGSLDTTFSGDGRVITNFGGWENANDVIMQSDGKIVVSGQKCPDAACDVALARYNANGMLDTTFSGDGKQTTDAGGDNGSEGGLAIQSDGKIVMAGYAWNGTDREFAIYRYNTNGSLDTTFSGNGIAIGNFGVSRLDVTRDLAIQSDGKIIVVGNSADESGDDFDFAIARLNSNGTADTTFSGDGRQRTNFGGFDAVYSVALQPNGKIVVVGFRVTPTGSRTQFAVVRYNLDGSLDTTFNGTGRKAFSISSGFDSWASDVIVQSDGKIVVEGDIGQSGSSLDFALVRLNPGGSFDTTFSGDGKITVDFGGKAAFFALALDPLEGKYVVGGYFDPEIGTTDMALARILP